MKEKSCGNCVNVYKYYSESEGRETWACEEFGFYHYGVPANVTPPFDEACDRWTDDPKKKDSWEKYV